MLVHGVGPRQQLLEVRHADGQGDWQADGRPQRVTAADPVPHREDVFFANTEGHGCRVVARYGDEVAIQLGFRATLGQVPGAGGLGVFRVSRVLKDFDETMNSVVSARSFMVSSWNSLPSIFAR